MMTKIGLLEAAGLKENNPLKVIIGQRDQQIK